MIVFGQTFPVKSRKISKQIAVLQKNVPVLNIPNEHLCYQPQNMKKLQCCKKCFSSKHLCYQVKSEIREMGVQLQRQNSEIQQALRQVNDDVASVQQEV